MARTMKNSKTKNIGINVEPPSKTCEDPKCPFHGNLKVRGKAIRGVVTSTRMEKTISVEWKRIVKVPKYERYEWRVSRIKAHVPPCLNHVREGDTVMVMECRPLSKTKKFVTIKVEEASKK